MKVINILPVMALTCLAMTGCKQDQTEGQHTQYVKTTEVLSTEGLSSVNYPGKTKAADEANISFRVSGPIASVKVKEGDYVRKGQLLASMDARDYQTQVNATQAEYQQVKADAERIIAMYQEGNTTASNYDKARFGLQQIEQKLSNHKHQLADTQLYAPSEGYVQAILHHAGETVAAGMPVISMFGSKAVEVEVNISAFDYANRDRLNSVYCTFDLLPDEQFPMTIKSISPEANASQLYTVRLNFTGPYDRTKITPGMTTMVYVNIDNTSDNQNTIIPTTAILEANDKPQVFVYDSKTGKVALQDVTIYKLHNDGTAEVSAGLTPGQTIVAAGIHHLTDGQQVTPLPQPSKSNIGNLM